MKNLFKIFSATLISLFLITQTESKGQDVSLILEHQFVSSQTNPLDYQLEYCKIWGLMKYYHPDAGKNKVDIDQIFLDLYPEMTSLQDEVSFNRFIAKFMKHFRDMNADKLSEEEYKAVLDNQLEKTKKFSFLKDSVGYYSNLDFSWLKENSLTPELKKKVVALLLYSNSKKTPNLTGRYFNEDKLEDFKAIDPVSATLSLFKYWNIVAYKYPYVYLLDEDWSQAFLKNYIHFTQIKNRQEYIQAIQRVVAATQDNHSFLDDRLKTEQITGPFLFPFEMTIIKDSMIVSAILNKKFCDENNIKQGDNIVSVNGRTIKELKDSLKFFIPYSIPENFEYHLNDYINNRYIFPDTILVQFKSQEHSPKKIFLMDIALRTYLDIYLPQPKYMVIENQIAYIRNACVTSQKEEKEMYRNIKDCKSIILDFRQHLIFIRGRMDYLAIRLSDKPLNVSTDYCAYNKCKGTYKKRITASFASLIETRFRRMKAPDFPKNIVVLIGNNSLSALETHCMIAKTYAPQAVFIGGKTAGADGGVDFIDLPDNIRVNLAFTDFRFADGTQIQRKGIQPDIEVLPTILGIREGRDEVLERAIEYIKNGK